MKNEENINKSQPFTGAEESITEPKLPFKDAMLVIVLLLYLIVFTLLIFLLPIGMLTGAVTFFYTSYILPITLVNVLLLGMFAAYYIIRVRDYAKNLTENPKSSFTLFKFIKSSGYFIIITFLFILLYIIYHALPEGCLLYSNRLLLLPYRVFFPLGILFSISSLFINIFWIIIIVNSNFRKAEERYRDNQNKK